MSLLSNYYKQILYQLKRGNYRGVVSNAKPILLLAIFQGVENGSLLGNCIVLDDCLKKLYLDSNSLYNNKGIVTPIIKPFFHLHNEPFYNLKYKTKDGNQICNTPSAKFLRENVEYAYLDDQLWELLQDAEIREEYKQALIDRFITPSK